MQTTPNWLPLGEALLGASYMKCHGTHKQAVANNNNDKKLKKLIEPYLAVLN